jgi:hypothetical protein
MRLLLRLAVLSAAATASGAQACVDASAMESYFSYRQPFRHGQTPMLRVTIETVDRNVVRARLVGPFARLSTDGTVIIHLPALPGGGSCLEMGPVDGPVYVIGTLIRTHSGALSLEAMPTPYMPRRRIHSRAEIESYILPADLPPAPAPRHKGRQ